MTDYSYSAQRKTGDRSFLPLPTANRLPLTARGLAAQGRVGTASRHRCILFKRLAVRPPHGGRRVGAGLRHALMHFISGDG